MAKNKKIEKETRRLMEAVNELVKKKGNGYKFKPKTKKKRIKAVRKTCPHWLWRKGKPVPATIPDPNRPGYWLCTVCKTSFPVKPMSLDEYNAISDSFLETVNQMQFLSVKLGGDKEDTEMFITLRKMVPRFQKATKHIHKLVNRREQWEQNRERSDALAQFDAYTGFSYKP